MKEGLLSLPGSLKIYRVFGGFPVDVDPCDPGGCPASDRALLARPLALVGLFSVALAISMVQMESMFGRVGDLEALASAMGVTKEDAMLPLLFFCMNWCISTCYFFLFVYRWKKIVKLYKNLAILDCRISHSTSGILRGANMLWMSNFFFGYILVFGTGICYSILMQKAFISKADGQLSLLDWAAVLSYGFAGSFSATNPMIVSGITCLCDVLVTLGDICTQWEAKIKTISPQRNSAQKASKHQGRQLVLTQMSIGNEYCELVSLANKTLSPFIVVMYMYFLAGGVMYAYGGFGLAMQNSKGLIPLLLCTAALALTLIFCASMWILSLMGNRFAEKRDTLRATLGQILSQACSDSDNGMKFEVQECLNRLEQAKISPYGYFEITNSNFLGMIATNVTYIIVLLQFKGTTVQE